MTTLNHYNAAYFNTQRSAGELGQWITAKQFSPHIDPTDTVVDFGCGGGWLLEALDCGAKIGVEPNSSACQEARRRVSHLFGRSNELPTDSADIVISNHALEHCERPLDELRELYRATKPGGRLVIIVPVESWRVRFNPTDQNRHLYTWSPMNLGNLVREAGYSVTSVLPIHIRWPPFHRQIAAIDYRLFLAASTIWGQLSKKITQVKAVAVKGGD